VVCFAGCGLLFAVVVAVGLLRSLVVWGLVRLSYNPLGLVLIQSYSSDIQSLVLVIGSFSGFMLA